MHARCGRLICALLCGSFVAAAAPEALAQAYPARPVRLVVPYAPGGPSDIVGRLLAQSLGDLFGQPMVVENRAGGSATIGTASVAKAAPDGYTLLLADIGGFFVNPYFFKSLPYDARTDFTPISPVVSGAIFLFVNASLPARDVRELIALAKSKPGSLTFGSSGAGSFSAHLAPELFKLKHGLDILHVPYKGAGPAMMDVVAGRISLIMTTGYGTAKPFLDSGKLRALAVTGERRSRAAPDVPTFAEAGSPLPEINAGGIFGLVGPAGLARNIVVKLNESLLQALASREVLAKLAALNLEPMPMAPEAFGGFISAQMDTWAALLKRMNIKAD
ncbi:MAG: tripartite tricarboxylate transporter substrate binding protein [Betaproteobacteria bacterium]|nr:tripartite tricarboxylate transporter substrate binding protein [Betaproteobacteria bacterium]MBI2959246.1 tripartite tricarboxylate transporter substrate binding protein [Betaproteobacteria bacterium]